MTPEQNDYLNQQSYLRQTQERRDARANMPGPSGTNGMSQARFQQHQARMQSDAARAQMDHQAIQARAEAARNSINQNRNNALDTYNSVNNMQDQMDRRSQGGPSQAYLDRYNGGRPMNNESAGPAPTPGRMMTQAVPENGGGIEDIRMSTQAVGEEGGGGMRRPDSGMDITMAVGENGGGGGISTVRDRLNPNQQRRYDRRNERYQRRDARANRRHAEDMEQARANGASKEEMMGKSLQHHMDSTQRNMQHHQKMQGFYGPKGGDGGATTAAVGEKGGGITRNPNPPKGPEGYPAPNFPDGPKGTTRAVGENGGGGSRPNFPGMPGFAPPKAGTARPYEGGGKPAQPRPNPTSEISPAPQPRPNPTPKPQGELAPAPNPQKEQRQADRTERREARAERREARQERRDNRAEKRAKRAEAQNFKNNRQKRITGKDEMPYS